MSDLDELVATVRGSAKYRSVCEDVVRGVLGGNFRRVAGQVWK